MTTDRTSLPPNVRRWLDRCLPANAPIPNRILNTQEGEMDIRGKWMPFAATTVDRTEPFTFAWKARLRMLPGVWVVAEDGHNGQQGWGGAKLWGIIPMGGRQAPEAFAMQLVRSLAELAWKPQFALAIPDLEWKDTGDSAFEARIVRGEREASVRFDLGQDGDLLRASSKRYYDIPNGFVEAPWSYDFSGHRDYAGIRIPSTAVAVYVKPDGPWEYWRGRITSVVPG